MDLPTNRKWLLAESLTVTRLALNAHTDSNIPKHGIAALKKRYMQVVRSATGCFSVDKIGKYYTDMDALSAAEALPWDQLIAIERLRYLGRLFQFAPNGLPYLNRPILLPTHGTR